ncbi:complex I subunit 1 family protein [Micromonospora sp. WMMD980]|uniref:complex I subunit 1 family protein n=1 Tax=Micromonospora sp. WMMD980 TaxID=3016088 RepID=UPI0024180E77|nr:complex I subunit 1 family protein [Micromonospora sp. WMMD980]MDG4801423.1 NADH-quinone oxidoreductase subunit H [Micromonospora sp. WMMD980]
MTAGPWWGVLPAAGVLLGLALAAAVLAGLLDPAGGPTVAYRAGRPLWETARLLRQRRRTVTAADLLLWRLGLAGPLVVALLMVVVVPLGDRVVADLPVGVVWFNAMDVLLWAAAWLAGWGSNSGYGLVGGYRFLAQALGYELPLMFALTAPAVAAGSLRIADVVAAQRELWFVGWMPVAFLVLLGAALAFSMSGPFAYPNGRDVAGGVLAEPSGVDRLVLLAGRYAVLVAGAATAVALFLGGGSGPLLPAWLWSVAKTLAVLAVLVALRGRVPVLRADRLMRVAWLVVLPATLAQVLVVAVLVVGRG